VRNRILLLAAAVGVIGAACTSADYEFDGLVPTSSTVATPDDAFSVEAVIVEPAERASARNQIGYVFPPAPPTDTGPSDPVLAVDIQALIRGLDVSFNFETLARIGDSGDPRAAWLLSDILRFVGRGEVEAALVEAFEDLTGASLASDPVLERSSWQSMTDHLIAWDIPALEGYAQWKSELFTRVEPEWQAFFDDGDALIDWRLVSWGGVLIDDRPLGTATGCVRGCIPALDDPAVTEASEGNWYPDDRIVFGVTVNGESRAYPKNIMEVHEMVNDTLGGRRLGIPYCTLCGSAQAYFTDEVPDGVAEPILRTSGLLSRSNKVMYDLVTFSVLDTFTGEALSGPLLDAGVTLSQTSVVTSTWGEWKAAHPDTTIVARDGGIGRSYDLDPLGGRDDDGPIFPIGDVDDRLPVQAKVLGVLDEGAAIAFDVEAALATIAAGGAVVWNDIEVVADGSGVRAMRIDGTSVAAHEAFWFAWSQFHPDTLVWTTSS
jgi:hypothetical protein